MTQVFSIEEVATSEIAISKTLIGDREINSVNLRDVWEFLGSRQDFSDWVKNRVKEFSQGVDFIKNHKVMEKGRKPLTEYIATIDTAKMICMVERNAKGHELRRYFVECEKELKKKSTLPDFNNPVEAARAWASLCFNLDFLDSVCGDIETMAGMVRSGESVKNYSFE